MNDRIAFLEISSYCGLGQHWFGKVRFGTDHIPCTKVISQKEADRFNRYDRWNTYKKGMETTRLASESEVIGIALSVWKERFPDALILVRGYRCYYEPQFALDGPKNLIDKLNILYQQAKEIGWWDEDEVAMEQISDEWYALLEKARFEQTNQDRILFQE